jgi:hypothetical protein
MRKKLFVGFALAIVAGIAGAWFVMSRAPSATHGDVHLALVGASIGQDWHIAEWPVRAQARSFSAESLAIWQFDKTQAVDELLLRPKRRFRLTRTYVRSLFAPPPRKPDLVILKECSSYFPGDQESQRAAFRAWEERLSAAGTTVVLATVVPVTQTRAQKDAGKQEALTAFNGWVREYAAQKKLPVLDLDAAMRSGEPGSHLKDEFTSGDGSHLNAAAYAVLDRTLRNTLCGVRADAACARVAGNL